MTWISQVRPRRPSLFWRTFFLLCSLIFISVVGWLQSFRVLTELPYSQSIAQHLISTVNITRHVLLNVDPSFRADLLRTLASEEGIYVRPKYETDHGYPIKGDGYAGLVEKIVRTELGPKTVIMKNINGADGLWVSFVLDGDQYWIRMNDDFLDPPFGTTWLWWALSAGLASLLGAYLLSRHITTPLKRLSSAAKTVGTGENPPKLSEEETTEEILLLNESFNKMVGDLQHMADDRELLLAGVSHDLRTPITRLRLEVEMAEIPQESRDAMISDLEQMENIVNQFLAYARRSNEELAVVDFGTAMEEALLNARLWQDPSISVSTDISHEVYVKAHALELSRALQNIITNASRYGRCPDGSLKLDVVLHKDKTKRNAVLAFSDRGAGLPEEERLRVMRPFERGESARTGVSGSGLGLSIVDRIIRRFGGKVVLDGAEPNGLKIVISLPLVSKREEKKFKAEEKAGREEAAEEQKPIEHPSSPGDDLLNDPQFKDLIITDEEKSPEEKNNPR